MIFNGKKNGWAYLTITADGDDCAFTYPLEPKESLLAKEDLFKVSLLSDMYPGAQVKAKDGESTLEAFERWIAEGCINLVPVISAELTILSYTEVVVQKVPCTRVHPDDLDDFDKTDEQIVALAELKKSDADMARIGEDLIRILISQDVLTEDAFHSTVLEKLNKRDELRKKI